MQARPDLTRLRRIALEVALPEAGAPQVEDWSDEGSLLRVGDVVVLHLPGAQRVGERQCPRLGQEAGLDAGLEVEGIVHDLQEGVGERPHLADVPQALGQPEGHADVLPRLLLEVPGDVERVPDVHQAELIALAPDHLLAADAEADRHVLQLEVDVHLAQPVRELVVRPVLAVQATVRSRQQGASRADGADPIAPDRATDEIVVAGLTDLVTGRRDVVEAVVHTPIEEVQLRSLDERNVELVDQLAVLQPVPVDAEPERVAVLNELELAEFRMTDQVLRFEVSRDLKLPVLDRSARRPRADADRHDGHEAHRKQPTPSRVRTSC